MNTSPRINMTNYPTQKHEAIVYEDVLHSEFGKSLNRVGRRSLRRDNKYIQNY